MRPAGSFVELAFERAFTTGDLVRAQEALERAWRLDPRSPRDADVRARLRAKLAVVREKAAPRDRVKLDAIERALAR